MRCINLTVVSVKGWFSNEETPGQFRTIYYERERDGKRCRDSRMTERGLKRRHVERNKGGSTGERSQRMFKKKKTQFVTAADLYSPHKRHMI